MKMPSEGKKSEKGDVIIGVIAAIFVNDVLHFSGGEVAQIASIGSCMSTKTKRPSLW